MKISVLKLLMLISISSLSTCFSHQYERQEFCVGGGYHIEANNNTILQCQEKVKKKTLRDFHDQMACALVDDVYHQQFKEETGLDMREISCIPFDVKNLKQLQQYFADYLVK